MDTRWLIRMARWARKPPSKTQILIWVVVVVAALSVAGIEYFSGTPDWMKIEKMRP